jgi:anaerobic selenocysteine-containing dehydrogenase
LVTLPQSRRDRGRPRLIRQAAAAPAAAGAPPAPARDGGLALVIGTRLFDRGTMALRCPGIRGQAGEPFVGLHPNDAARLGVAEALVCDVRSARGALRLPARVLPTLHPGHAYVPRGYESAPVSALLDERGPVAVTVRPVGGAA